MTDWPDWMDEYPMEYWRHEDVQEFIRTHHRLWEKRMACQMFKDQIGERIRSDS